MFLARIAILTISLGCCAYGEKLYGVSVAALSGCAVADVATTQLVIAAGGYETNPMMRNGGVWMKAGITVGIFGLQWALRKRASRKLMATTNFIAAGAWCGAAGWNATQIRR